MSTLSQFFGGGSTTGAATVSTIGGKGSVMQLFATSGTLTIPSSATYMAAGVIGGGGGGGMQAPGYWCTGGGGGGFSYRDGPLSIPAPITVCAIIGAGGCVCPPYSYFRGSGTAGGDTCVCGMPAPWTAAICATGGCSGYGPNSCTTDGAGGGAGGCGFGGLINNRGGHSYASACASCRQCFGGGGGAGGIFGPGGRGGICMSGGGFGSGGGGGGAAYSGGYWAEGGGGGQSGTGCQSPGGPNYMFGGSGIVGRGGVSYSPDPTNFYLQKPENGFQYHYTTSGLYSQGKTFFGAAGGGGASSQTGATGGGGGQSGDGGFGGGSGLPMGGSSPGLVLRPTRIGGGGGSCSSPGQNGIAFIEYFI